MRGKEEYQLTDFHFWAVVIADTSPYITGFDEGPVSVTVVGVDPDGRKTWRIVPSKPTGAISPRPFSLTGKPLHQRPFRRSPLRFLPRSSRFEPFMRNRFGNRT